MRTKKHRVLVDCDGVLANFAQLALDLIEERTGDRHSLEEIKQWDIFKAVNKPELEHILTDAVEHEGFCIKLRPLPGAKEMMQTLVERYDVYVVTSPYLARNWVYERTRWLESHFGIPQHRVCNVKDKFIIPGAALIDDSEKNLRLWSQDWPSGYPILFDAMQNRDEKAFTRALTHADVVRLLEERLK